MVFLSSAVATAWRELMLTRSASRAFTTTAICIAKAPPRPIARPGTGTRPIDPKTPAKTTSLNIFHAGSALTAYIGTLKLAGIYIFAQSCLLQAPTIYLESPNDFLWTPFAIALSSVPMLVLQLLTGPFVNSIDLALPPASNLRSYSRSPPPDARLAITTLRFFPLPKRRAFLVQDLRTLPPRRFRVANLEYLPPRLREQCEAQGREPGWFEAWRAGRRRFHVRPGTRFTDGTRGPGVWDDVLAAIGRNSQRGGTPRRK